MSVTLLCFGRKGYAFATANMVATLRYHGYAGTIHLHVGASLRAVLPQYVHDQCTVHDLAPEFAADPGWCKINLPVIATEPTLYLDVDGCAIRDITPLIAAVKADGRPYITSVMATGKDGDSINHFEWATTTTVRKLMGFGPDATYYGIQSSWAWIVPNELHDMHAEMLAAWEVIQRDDLRFQWGTSKPDELYWSIACTASEYNPAWHEHPVFFGHAYKTLEQLRTDHCFISLLGDGRNNSRAISQRYVDMYDAQVQAAGKTFHPVYKSGHVRKDKFVNFKTH